MRVILSNIANLKLKYYVDGIDQEISGVGLVEKKGEDLYVSDVFLFKQTVTGAETKLNRKSLVDFALEKLDIPEFPVENLKLWWHSHVNMGVFWSGTDEETIEGFDKDLPEDNWHLSIVCNKRGERKARIDTWQPFRMTADDLHVAINEDPDLEELIGKEIDELVTKSTPEVVKPVIYNAQNEPMNFADQSSFSPSQGQIWGKHMKKKNKKWKH